MTEKGIVNCHPPENEMLMLSGPPGDKKRYPPPPQNKMLMHSAPPGDKDEVDPPPHKTLMLCGPPSDKKGGEIFLC